MYLLKKATAQRYNPGFSPKVSNCTSTDRIGQRIPSLQKYIIHKTSDEEAQIETKRIVWFWASSTQYHWRIEQFSLARA